jgi:hypothetical protein
MKKIIILSLLFFGISFSSFSQKPMIGLSEDLIVKINKDEFGAGQKFEKDYFEKFWILHTEYLGVVCVYYFFYNRSDNFLFTQIIDDMDVAKLLYQSAKERHISLDDFLFFEKRTNLYIHFKKSDNGSVVITWSKERING